MPNRKKKPQRFSSGTKFLLALAVLMFGGIWVVEQAATQGLGPEWLQILFADAEPASGLQVGLIMITKGTDSGVVCDDGLTEAEINLRVAELTAERLAQQGVTAQIFEEFDREMRGLTADALVAIHSDSCQVDFSGFKVASEEGGSDASQRLAECLWNEYEGATQLDRHPSTITNDMTRYHAFREISVRTPAAIIELGFMNADRGLIADQPELAAEGVANGILCFLTPQPSEAASTTP